MNRQSEKNPDFDYEVYPTPKEIEGLLNEMNSSVAGNKVQSNGIFTTVAPYYNTPVTKENIKEVRAKVEKDFKEKANSIATSLGISIRNINTNIGGFEFQEGETAGQQVTELSYTFELDTEDTFLADTFAYLLGQLGYEKQEAVISANYVNDSKDANAIELSIKVRQNAGVLEALKKAGITDYTVDLSTHTIKILGFDLNDLTGLDEKLTSIEKELGDNYEQAEYRKIQSRYLDKGARKNIREAWHKRGSSQNRQLHSYLTQAERQEAVPVQETRRTTLAIDVNELQLKASAVLGSPQVTLVMRT